MVTRNVAIEESDFQSYAEQASLRNSRRAATRTRVAGLPAPLPSAASELDGSTELDRYFHNDYRIALVPHDKATLSSGPNVAVPAGAHGMLLLPLTWRELLDRVRRELHSATPTPHITARFGEVRINFLTMEISRSRQPVLLTNQEFKLLKFFVENPQRVLSRDELLNEVWGYNHYPSTRTVDNHVWMLRRKLELRPARPVHFLTVQRIGYKFVPQKTEWVPEVPE